MVVFDLKSKTSIFGAITRQTLFVCFRFVKMLHNGCFCIDNKKGRNPGKDFFLNIPEKTSVRCRLFSVVTGTPVIPHVTMRLPELLDIPVIVVVQIFLLSSDVIGLPLHLLMLVIGICISWFGISMMILFSFHLVLGIEITERGICISNGSQGKGSHSQHTG